MDMHAKLNTFLGSYQINTVDPYAYDVHGSPIYNSSYCGWRHPQPPCMQEYNWTWTT
jgi:hypothetical protein